MPSTSCITMHDSSAPSASEHAHLRGPQRDQPRGLGLQDGESRFGTHHPRPGSDVEVHTVLHHLALGHALEEQARPHPRSGSTHAKAEPCRSRRAERLLEFVPRGEAGRGRRYDVSQYVAPEQRDALRIRAIEGDLNLLHGGHRSTVEARTDDRRSEVTAGGDYAEAVGHEGRVGVRRVGRRVDPGAVQVGNAEVWLTYTPPVRFSDSATPTPRPRPERRPARPRGRVDRRRHPAVLLDRVRSRSRTLRSSR